MPNYIIVMDTYKFKKKIYDLGKNFRDADKILITLGFRAASGKNSPTPKKFKASFHDHILFISVKYSKLRSSKYQHFQGTSIN